MLSRSARAQIKAEIERLEGARKICNDVGIRKVIEGWIEQLKKKLISEEKSAERLRSLWLKALAATDPAEVETLLLEFRDALHEHLDQLKAGAKKLPTAS
jgi:hypothetical protein